MEIVLNYQRYGAFAHIFEGPPESKQHQWTTSNVKTILSNEVYIGNSVHNKQTTISFKNKKKIRKSKDEWFTVENTHEPIISMELWEQAQIEEKKQALQAKLDKSAQNTDGRAAVFISSHSTKHRLTKAPVECIIVL